MPTILTYDEILQNPMNQFIQFGDFLSATGDPVKEGLIVKVANGLGSTDYYRSYPGGWVWDHRN